MSFLGEFDVSRILAAATAVLLLTLAPAGPGAPPAEAGSGVAVRVSCFSNPETTKITNNTGASIKVRTVGSTYQPYSYEPFSVGKTLAPGASVTYQTGRAAFKNVLSRNYIYNDKGDKARVVTTVGTFTKTC